MRNLTGYIELAKEKAGLSSDAKLAAALDLNPTSITQWRNGRAKPSDDIMVNLAKLAGVPKDEALLELNVWRATGNAQSAYREMLKRMQVTAIAVLIAVFLVPSMAIAAPSASHDGAYSVYYGN